mmetsp:Transcript_23119/g.54590  ORF Transcript_23119/g.54590 Transcript_23119/m.54590 type:complete len:216 (-) Transcript_23119:19-666(-)
MGKKTGHRNHGGTSILHFYNLVPFCRFGGQLLGKTHPVEVQVTRCLGGLSSEVVSGVSNTFSLTNSNEEEDASEPSRLFLSKNSKSLCPVGFLRESRNVHAESHTTLVRSPNSGPRDHSLTSVLDFGFLQELNIREHAWEGVETLASSELGQVERIEWNSPNFFVAGGLKGRLRGSRLLRGKRRSGCNKRGEEGSRKLGHGGNLVIMETTCRDKV